MDEKLTIISNTKCWMEQTALNQIASAANLPGVIKAVGLPDLHAGKSPIGIAIKTEGICYPHLIGNDIGCGMGLFYTGIDKRKFKQDRFVTKLNYIRALEDLETNSPYEEESPIYDLGTIGGGNHFAEFQVLEDVFDQAEFETLSMNREQVMLLIHSGSRGYGQSILNKFLNFDGLKGEEAKAYMEKHDNALVWAYRNRLIVAEKLVEYLGFSGDVDKIIDCTHNFMEYSDGFFIHRKGAVSAQNGPVIIPGSRGSLTYIVKPAADTQLTLHSLSHGAGRKWARSLCKGRIKEKYNRDTIRQTKLKSKVVCHDTELLYQEAPEAYKNVEQVIDALLEYHLITVIATLRPVITYKG